MKMKESIRKPLLFTLLAVVSLLVFSYGSSPLWPNDVNHNDQCIFSVIGWNWAHGLLPYVTAWDSKGPIIFFFNMLGHLFTDGEAGIFTLQVINLAAVLWLSDRFLRKYVTGKQSFFFCLCFLLAYIIVCTGGNQVSDYTLLLSVASVFCTYKWSLDFQAGQCAHPWRFAFVYGLFFSACLLSRMTNAMLLSASVFVVFVVLVYHRLWKNLLANVLGFMAGFATMFVPFAVYFALHGAFGEMWYAMFTYNVEYALYSSSAKTHYSSFMLVYYLFYFICLEAVVVSSVLTFIDGKRKTALVWLAVSALTLLWLFKSYANANYVISYLPVLFVSLLQLAGKKGRRYVAARCFIAGVLLLGFLNHVRIFSTYVEDGKEDVESQLAIISDIPQGDSFVAYNCHPAVYLRAQRHPHYQYFILQDWAIENGQSLRERVHACYSHGDVQWILLYKGYKDPCTIQDVLQKNYEVYKKDETNQLVLYKRRNL